MMYDPDELVEVRGGEKRRVPLHGPDAFAAMRKAGALAAQTLDYIYEYVRPGVSTGELDRLCEAFIRDHGATPAPLGYRGYPKSICTSINHVVCHGIPSDDKKLRDGDVLNIDVTVILDGWHGDSSRMYAAGKPKLAAAKLIDTTYECLMAGIAVVKPGARVGDIGHAIQAIAEKRRYSVVRDFCGHGLGQVFHDAPTILHYGRRGDGMPLVPGMLFTIEPMINQGGWRVTMMKDGWTAITQDRKLSAQFEHSIGVTEEGCEIFTLSPGGRHNPIRDAA